MDEHIFRLAKRVTRSPLIALNHSETYMDVNSNERKDPHVNESSSDANLNKGKQQSLDDSVCSFNNVRKIR
ncbi:hypothetical protein Tco_0929495 [Tanacetum coccineum]